MRNKKEMRYLKVDLPEIENEIYSLSEVDIFKLTVIFRITENRIHELIAIVNQSVLENRIDYCKFMFKRDEQTIKRGKNLRFALYCIDSYDSLIAGLCGLSVAGFNTITYGKDQAVDVRFMLLASSFTMSILGVAKIAGSYIRPMIDEKHNNEEELLTKLINMARTGDLNDGVVTQRTRKIGISSFDRLKISIPCLSGLFPSEIEQQLSGASIIPVSERSAAWVKNEFNRLHVANESKCYGTFKNL